MLSWGEMSAEAFTATHAILFAEPKREGSADEPRCDVCGEAVTVDDDGFAVGGRGLYLWTRGGELRFEEPPLCASCGTAIGLMALAQWDVEEEEG